jgi:2-dehydropantoate 2-reductase
MRIAVIGAGGTGGLYGGLLARAGHDVSFLARGANLAALRRNGLEVRSAEFGTFRVHAPASDDPADLGQADLVLFAVKTYDLESAAPAAAQALAPDGGMLTLQNGLEAPDQLAPVVGAERVLIGTTALETTILEPGVIGHLSRVHAVTVSSFDGPPTAQVERTVAVLTEAGINAKVAADGRRALWEKAWVLIPMATLTTVCQSPIGPIRELPETRAMAQALVREVELIARACGYDMPELTARTLAALDQVAPSMKASMARDFERGGRTELEALTGALVRLADQKGLDIPTTRATYAILKLRERELAGARGAVGNGAASE